MVPQLAGGRTVYGPLYGDLGDTPTEVVGTAIEDPGAIAGRLRDNGAPSYAVQLMAPMAFTPLAAPGLLLLGAPQAVVNLLSTANFTWDVRYHYAALPVVALALGMVEGISAIDRWARRRAPRGPSAVRRGVLGVTLAAALYSTWAWGPSPVSVRYEDGYWPRRTHGDHRCQGCGRRRDPGGAAVSADYNLVPHLTHRELIYTFPNPWISSNYGVDGRGLPDPATVEWIVVDINLLDLTSRTLFDQLFASGQFSVESYDDGIIVATGPPPSLTARSEGEAEHDHGRADSVVALDRIAHGEAHAAMERDRCLVDRCRDGGDHPAVFASRELEESVVHAACEATSPVIRMHADKVDVRLVGRGGRHEADQEAHDLVAILGDEARAAEVIEEEPWQCVRDRPPPPAVDQPDDRGVILRRGVPKRFHLSVSGDEVALGHRAHHGHVERGELSRELTNEPGETVAAVGDLRVVLRVRRPDAPLHGDIDSLLIEREVEELDHGALVAFQIGHEWRLSQVPGAR